MPYVIEVDQSNMVEEPGDTYLAFSNGISWAIRVPVAVKQAGFEALRDRRKSKKTAKLRAWSARAEGKADRTITTRELLDLVR